RVASGGAHPRDRDRPGRRLPVRLRRPGPSPQDGPAVARRDPGAPRLLLLPRRHCVRPAGPALVSGEGGRHRGAEEALALRAGDRDAADDRGLSMSVVDAVAASIAGRPLETMAPHPLGEVRFDGTPPLLQRAEGEDYPLALATLDAFRPSVGAIARGLAARAL